MSILLIRPFVPGRPILATIYVERQRRGEPGREKLIRARVGRNEGGDLYELRYGRGVPIGFHILKRQGDLDISLDASEPEPFVSPARFDPRTVPAPFPPEPPNEAPIDYFGVLCFERCSQRGAERYLCWYSYEYAVEVRQVIENEERGTTIWTLEDVVLGKGVEETLTELASFDRDRMEANLLDLAVRVLGA